MIDKSELLRVPAFTDLPEEQIAWFLSQSQETHVKAGETYVRQGDPADWMFVILEGRIRWRDCCTFSQGGRCDRCIAVLQDEAVHCNRSSYHRRPSSEISRCAISRTRAEDAR